MKLKDAYIYKMGHYHPETVLDNSFFDLLEIGSEASWIEERTGIRSRRTVMKPRDILALKNKSKTMTQICDEGGVESIADIGQRAWQNMIGSGDPSLNPDLLICGSSVPDFAIPANASTIAARLGLKSTAFDANSACSSFVTNIHLARGLIASGMHRSIAVFNPERYSLKVDFNDRNSCVLFGDGSTCAYLGDEEEPGSLRIVDSLIASDPEGHDLVKIPIDGLFSQRGAAVQKFAITKTIEVSRAIMDRNALNPDEISYFTGHQANLRMIKSAVEKLGIDSRKHLYNVDDYGNQGAAGAPAVLSMNWERFQKGDRILVAVVGSGLTWGAALLEKV